jgi:hypothetical protein
MKIRLLIICLTTGFLAGCLDFGRDTELLAPQVTSQHLQNVSSVTGIQFPEGSVGLAYYYLGSGIDDGLAIKVAIPSDKKDLFLRNDIFIKGKNTTPGIHIGKSRTWWKIDTLTNRIDRTLQLPKAQYVECSLGIEDGQWVSYISWMST